MNIKEKIENNPLLFSLASRIIYLLNILSGYTIEKKRFYKRLGYKLNLQNPRSFNEKIVWKKIYDRNSLLPITADKHKVRQYLKDTLGEEKANEILIPLLYVTDNPETIPFEELPSNFIIKANHGSGTNIIVENGNYNKDEIIKECKKWLRSPYGLNKIEWAYQGIERRIIVERLLKDEEGKLPKDYKFFVFHGKCRLIQVDFDRHEKHSQSFYNRQWGYLNLKRTKPKGKIEKAPKNYIKMLEIVENLGKKFDFVRIDLYSLNNKIFFGEITHYPAAGIKPFIPQIFDFELGKHWKIEPEYWKK